MIQLTHETGEPSEEDLLASELASRAFAVRQTNASCALEGIEQERDPLRDRWVAGEITTEEYSELVEKRFHSEVAEINARIAAEKKAGSPKP